MAWEYDQSSGEVKHGGILIGKGYSGTGVGRDNPSMDHITDTGPIPRGSYLISPAYTHPRFGPTVMNLDPIGHNAKGRTLFRIHGNNAINDASKGCIILGPSIRKKIAASADRKLEVIK